MKKLVKCILWILAVPIILFASLMLLLYVPPIQHYACQKAVKAASDATGYDVTLERIDLRFPLNLLLSQVNVVNPPDKETGRLTPDTLASLATLNLRIQALPLFHGHVEIDEATLEQASVNSADLIDGIRIKGQLGRFTLASHGINLLQEEVTLDGVELNNTKLYVEYADTTAADTTTTDLPWRIHLKDLSVRDFSCHLSMPLDTMQITASVGSIEANGADVDLHKQAYALQHLALSDGMVAYDTDTLAAASGFDPAHIHLRDLNATLDSVSYCGRDIRAVLNGLTLNERSGIELTAASARIISDSVKIDIPQCVLATAYSKIDFTSTIPWSMVDGQMSDKISARLNAAIGKEDVMALAGDLPKSFKKAYPSRPLIIHSALDGSLENLEISRLYARLPGALRVEGRGEFCQVLDSLNRSGDISIEVGTGNLNFVTGLAGITPGGDIVVPDSMLLKCRLGLKGPLCTAKALLKERQGTVNLDARYDLNREAYKADVAVRQLRIDHFMPHDSIYALNATLHMDGIGTDISAARTSANAHFSLDGLEYGSLLLDDVSFDAALKRHVLTAHLSSGNPLLQLVADADMRMDRKYLDGTANIDLKQIDLFKFGVAPEPLAHPFSFSAKAEARKDSVKASLSAGDLEVDLKARSTIKQLVEQGMKFYEVLLRQIDEHHLDHAELRRVLPTAGMRITAGKHNAVYDYLATQKISYDDFSFGFGFTPSRGINGRTAIHGLRYDSLQIDTIFFRISQDTTRMALQGGVINGPSNPQFVFRALLNGEIRNEDAELKLNFIDKDGREGVNLGFNARPLLEGHGKGNGLLLRVIPEEPIVAYRKFHFSDKADWVYIHKNMRVYANVDMDSDNGLCFKMKSNQEDTLSLQNINLELNRLPLADLCEVIPYMPRISGLFSIETHYVQSEASLQLSSEADVRNFTYEGQKVGDLGLGVTWLPDENGTHYVNSYLTFDDEEVLTADGTYRMMDNRDTLAVKAVLEHFPLRMANAFIPDRMVSFTGDTDGELTLSGSSTQPVVDGSLMLDSVSLYARQAGARYWFDERPVKVVRNQLQFDKFAIYTTSKNPFVIDGNVDFRNLESPSADLKLSAKNYTLLEAKRTRESIVYGNVYVDVDASVRGPLDALTMRGDMNLLGNTDVTYIWTDSPLMVEDRMDGLVTFTSFADTLAIAPADAVPTLSLGGLNMNMNLHVDEGVHLRADLSSDKSKFVELIGGGDLTMQYTSAGDVNLSGRYTLTGGTLKYSLPVIPLEEFKINSGSYVEWHGNPMTPNLSLKATEIKRASVEEESGSGTRMVTFHTSISITGNLESPELAFDMEAPDDATIQNELQSMGSEERSKQAIAMLATGIYLNNGLGGAGSLSMGTALNSVLQSQINSLAGSALASANASFSMGVENRTSGETGSTSTDYSFKYSQRFFGDRFQINIGGKISTGANATNNVGSFIDNISLEYRLDTSGTRYVRLFRDKNYESVLDGEITETGAGVVLRRKMDRLSELFLFRRKK